MLLYSHSGKGRCGEAIGISGLTGSLIEDLVVSGDVSVIEGRRESVKRISGNDLYRSINSRRV